MAFYDSNPTLKRRGITPFVSDAAAGAGMAVPPAVQPSAPDKPKPLSTLGRLTRNVRPNAEALGRGIAAVRGFVNQEPGTPASETLGRKLAAPPPAVGTNGGAGNARATPVLVDPHQPSGAMVAGMRSAGVVPATPRGTIPATPALQAPAATPAVDSGVTLADGRKLNYGAMVNGVPTFSDGSGGFGGHPASIPRTMTDEDIAALGSRLNVVPATAFTNPIDTGKPTLTAPAGHKFGTSPQQASDARLAEVMSGDWRTPLGTAASNLKRSAGAASTVLQRKAALAALTNLQDSAARDAGLNTQGAAELQRQALVNQGQQAAENTRGQFGLADTRLRGASQLENTDLAGQYSLAGARATAAARSGLTEKDINDEAIKLLPQVMGIDPITQSIKDPNAPGGYRPATEAEIAGGMARARAIVRGMLAPNNAGSAPQKGDVVSGYRFKGGDPNVKANWEKV